ncbi:MAG TPA: pyruvate, phosphate dikinase [Thermomicrobiales bacterium]
MRRRWVRLFDEGSAADRDLLGGKGANLAEMTRLGLPVPPGFVITTEACRAYLNSDGQTPDGLWEEVEDALAAIEMRVGRRFGDPACPLLLSVRSGARISMPGMMDTILNVGIDERTIAGLARRHNPDFALDCARRLTEMYGRVVLGITDREFDCSVHQAVAAAEKAVNAGEQDALEQAVARLREAVAAHGAQFPRTPMEQLRGAVMAVFRSWNTPRAVAYRRAHNIPDDLGTAVNVQAMVFGNSGSDSATGVCFTRNPNTGEPGLFGEVLVDAQGEDVVAGIRTPLPIAAMRDDPALSSAYEQLLELAEHLELHYRDMQDIEFTVERGRLWLLQTRTGKRTPAAAVAIALAMAEEGLIDRETAVRRVEPSQLEQLLHPRIDESKPLQVIATGLPASPGAAAGRVVFDPMEARLLAERGEDVILVRQETSADDFPGMVGARGIVTARGGMTSHAAVVARGMGKPAVTGCGEIEIAPVGETFRAGKVVVHAGDEITIDGSTGRVMLGRAELIEPDLSGGAETLLSWADGYRRLRVRANADTPEDARRAREFGAEGIGLCRTEHMFFGEDRIDIVREMILAETAEERQQALAALEPLQVADFVGIFRAMAGCPVTIRTLDPPLHEFLPPTHEDRARLARRIGREVDEVEARIEALREANPMLGHRGCRLGITHPEITAMQARAIFRAALTCAAEGVEVFPEVMVPLVVDPEELRRQREVIEAEAEKLFAQEGRRVQYTIGTMIETPRAALLADRIAAHADFFSFGTNDLTQMTFALSRDDAGRFLPSYVDCGVLGADPFQVLDEDGVGQLIELATIRGRSANPKLKVGICGEHGGEPRAVAFFNRLGIDYVSCSPFRVPVARLAAARAQLNIAGAGH